MIGGTPADVIFREALIYSELPAAQGGAAKINRYQRLILQQRDKSHFAPLRALIIQGRINQSFLR